MPYSIHLPHGPRFTQQPPVHAREIPLALSQLGSEQRHAFDKTRVIEPPGIDEPEWRAVHEVEELPPGCVLVGHHINVAETAIEFRLIKYFPPDVLESTDDP